METKRSERIPPEALTTDLRLAEAVAARDRKAAADFVRLYADAVHVFVWNRLRPNTQPVEDIVQDVFLAAFAGIESYSGAAPLKAWLLAVARHKVEDFYRSRLRRTLSLDAEESAEPEDPSPTPVESFDAAETSERAAAALAAIRYDYALLLRWRYWDRLPARDMADRLGKTEKAIERMLARARREFRATWLAGREGGSGL
jgi:RNA polymerase sigma-70 factor (ECF subfamily)